MIRTRAAYRLVLAVLLPYVLARLAWRALRQPAYLRHLPERFGYYPHGTPVEPVIWIHAVSVGETHAAGPLMRALRGRYPEHRILLTHMTPTGREAGARLYGDSVEQCYLPYDFPGAVRRFLRHFHPGAGVLIETEIWPNLIHASRDAKVPLYLVNARLSEKSASGYRRSGALIRECLGDLEGVFAQSDADAARFRTLGAHDVAVMGNLKFDIDPAPEMLAVGEQWREVWAPRRVVLAASTRDGEEALLLDGLPLLATDVLLVIVPRHPQRFDAVAALLDRRKVSYQRRSAGTAVASGTRVLLGDSMGEMFAYYSACDVAFVGGSLLPYGGHNLIEACAVGRPVLLGPSTYNFSGAAKAAIDAGVARRVEDATELMKVAQALLNSPSVVESMRASAEAFISTHRGAAQRIAGRIRVTA